MPTKRVRRPQGRRTATLTSAWRYRLLSGTWPDEADCPGATSAELAAVFFATDETAAQMWRECWEELLEEWIAGRPGTRGGAWWQFSAPEARRVLDDGAEWSPQGPLDSLPWDWRAVGGIPPLRRPAHVESEPKYLERLGLFLPGERRRIRPAAWKPALIDPRRFVEEMFGN